MLVQSIRASVLFPPSLSLRRRGGGGGVPFLFSLLFHDASPRALVLSLSLARAFFEFLYVAHQIFNCRPLVHATEPLRLLSLSLSLVFSFILGFFNLLYTCICRSVGVWVLRYIHIKISTIERGTFFPRVRFRCDVVSLTLLLLARDGCPAVH